MIWKFPVTTQQEQYALHFAKNTGDWKPTANFFSKLSKDDTVAHSAICEAVFADKFGFPYPPPKARGHKKWDFILNNFKIDVKGVFNNYPPDSDYGVVVNLEQFMEHGSDLYVHAIYNLTSNVVSLVGWCTWERTRELGIIVEKGEKQLRKTGSYWTCRETCKQNRLWQLEDMGTLEYFTKAFHPADNDLWEIESVKKLKLEATTGGLI